MGPFRLIYLTIICLSIAFLFAPGCSEDATTPEEMIDDPPDPVPETFVDVTFLGNQGVMLDDGVNKVVIDGMHTGGNTNGFWSALSSEDDLRLQGGQPPFDSVDVAIVTHNHIDHYSVGVIGHHLFNNGNARFLADAGVRSALQGWGSYASIASQVVINVNPAPDNRQSTTINGVDIEVLNMHHFTEVCGECGRNFAYIVTLGDLKLLHLGDVDMLDTGNVDSFPLAGEDIDILFLATPFPQFVTAAQRTILNNWISPRKIIALHINSNQQAEIVANINNIYPEAEILTVPMTTIRFEKKDFVD